MIPRYTREEMGRLWSDQARFERWLAVELAALDAWEALGRIPAGTATACRRHAKVDAKRIAELDAQVSHETAAFVSQVQETCGEEGRYIHYGLTSYDVVDTAQGIAMRDALLIIDNQLHELIRVLKRQAVAHRDTICMGRSHGIHGEPTTFGAKLAGYVFEFVRHNARLHAVQGRVAVGTISGPMGSYASVPPEVEAKVMEALQLSPEPAPTQITARDRHAEYTSLLALMGASIERLAIEIRHLARTEVREVEEPFEQGAQKGSSSMPHKRNPWRSERLSGLARLLRGYAQAGLESVQTWHERDIAQSSVERVALVDASIVCDFAFAEISEIVDGLIVYPERMRKNLDLSHGLVFSQPLLLALIDAGMSRDEAYRIVQAAAMKSWDEDRPYIEVLKESSRVTETVNLDEIFDERRFLEHIGVIFDRLDEVGF
ncbi:MAG: adenylosuccinate lyase [Actinomycetota bacterium]